MGAGLLKFSPVIQTAVANEVANAKADAIATARVIGVLAEAIADEASVRVPVTVAFLARLPNGTPSPVAQRA